MQPTAYPMIKESNNESHFARQAIGMMQKHTVPPSPENYSVWFYYAKSENHELSREINAILASGTTFTQEACDYLYNKYILANRGRQAVDTAAGNAQKVLTEVLKVINDFSGETKEYNENVDQYVETIGQKFEGTGIEGIVKELITATAGLKKSGEKITQKLEESKQEINQLKKNLQEVTIEAQRDPLTGAFNRKTFEKMFDELVAVAKENQTALCLLMIDIDHFKDFNDRFGHLIGDEVLKTVARTLIDTLKGRDVVARYGGEEFVVILPDTPIEGALKVGEMIRAGIASKELKRKDTGQVFGAITISMGVARFRPETDTLPTLIKRADDALYASKHKGRNQVSREAE